MKIKKLFVLFLIFLFSGCASKFIQKNVSSDSQAILQEKDSIIDLEIADPKNKTIEFPEISDSLMELRKDEELDKLSDIPFLADSGIVRINSLEERDFFFGYKTLQPIADVIAFYRTEMDFLGWQEFSISNFEKAALLIFQKSSKLCSIFIGSNNLQSFIEKNLISDQNKVKASSEPIDKSEINIFIFVGHKKIIM